jgi:hypothetical protein
MISSASVVVRVCSVYRLISEGTIEERMLQRCVFFPCLPARSLNDRVVMLVFAIALSASSVRSAAIAVRDLLFSAIVRR